MPRDEDDSDLDIKECGHNPQFIQTLNTKSKAFYISLTVIVALFFVGNIFHWQIEFIVQAISTLASVFIGGAAIRESVHTYSRSRVEAVELSEKYRQQR